MLQRFVFDADMDPEAFLPYADWNTPRHLTLDDIPKMRGAIQQGFSLSRLDQLRIIRDLEHALRRERG